MQTKKIISLEEWTEAQVKEIVKALLSTLHTVETAYGEDISKYLAGALLSSFICSIVYNRLNVKPKANHTKEEIHKYVSNSFLEVKTSIQEAVATGVQSAMSTYAQRPIEYYCQIKTVPETVNKKPC